MRAVLAKKLTVGTVFELLVAIDMRLLLAVLLSTAPLSTWADVNSPPAAAAPELPSFEQFRSETPEYIYKCNVERYFADDKFRRAMHVDSVPDNRAFNAQLADLVPRLIYDSLVSLHSLNPSLATQVWVHARKIKLRFVCSQSLTGFKAGAIAGTYKHFLLFGKRTINLGGFVPILVAKHDYAQGPRDLLYFKRAIFHEFLHDASLESKLLPHAKDALFNGAKKDVVYSCSNFVWRLPPPNLAPVSIDTTSESSLKFLDLYSLDSDIVDAYSNFVDSKRQKAIVAKEHAAHPERAFIQAVSYDQCMTCALARPAGNKMKKSQDPDDWARAQAVCSQTAPVIKAEVPAATPDATGAVDDAFHVDDLDDGQNSTE